MTERKSRLQQELRIIPLGWTVAAGISIVVVESVWSFVVPHFAHGDLPPRPWYDMLGAVGALLMAATILLTGYIYADAKRRGMNAVLWTVLVLLIPKPIGFIAYFLLRTPMLAPARNAARRLVRILPIVQSAATRSCRPVRAAATRSGAITFAAPTVERRWRQRRRPQRCQIRPPGLPGRRRCDDILDERKEQGR